MCWVMILFDVIGWYIELWVVVYKRSVFIDWFGNYLFFDVELYNYYDYGNGFNY